MDKPASLNSLLRRWQHEPAPAPDFAAGVWARIGQTRQIGWSTVAYRWALPLAASLALFLGVGAARLEARRAHAERMADHYVRTIDPVQIVAHAAHK